MKKEQVYETKERKSLKEVVYNNRGKIIAGIAIIGCGVCYVLASNKYKGELKETTNKLVDKVRELEYLEDDIIDLYEDNRTLSAILSEGVLQDAITTTSNKINSRKNKLRMYEDRLTNGDLNVKDYIDKIKKEVEILIKRKDLYETKLHNYEIKELVD